MFKRWIVLASLLACCGLARADGGTRWQEGIHYFPVQPAQPLQPGSPPGKIEVLEVFSYACPACNAFEPTATKLKAALPSTARMAYLPASFNPAEDWPVFQRAFLTAQALGIVDRSHDAMYNAVWGTGAGAGSLATFDRTTARPLPQTQQPTIQEIAQFYARFGIKPETFLSTAQSFAIDGQMRRADTQVAADGVDSTPTLIINGKYRFSPHSAGGFQQALDLALYLIDKESADHHS